MVRVINRAETIATLIERDGPDCILNCGRDYTDKDPMTIDHWMPQAWCRENGWTEEEINDISNLRLAHKTCNARKGHLLPDEDGNIPFARREPRAVAKSKRPVLCETCLSGRILLLGETCEDCGSGPQPQTAPKSTQLSPKDCPHSGVWHCWMCYLGFVERGSALNNLITGE